MKVAIMYSFALICIERGGSTRRGAGFSYAEVSSAQMNCGERSSRYCDRVTGIAANKRGFNPDEALILQLDVLAGKRVSRLQACREHRPGHQLV